jgi:hypothetical protein
VRPLDLNDSTMKKTSRNKVSEVGSDDILPEYDFSAGRRNKYAESYRQATNIVQLDPDVAELFPDSASVNEALRALGRIAQRRKSRSRRRRPA